MIDLNLPDDILYHILLVTPYNDIFNLCRTNRFQKLCTNNFWNNKSYHDFQHLLQLTEYFYSYWSDIERYRMLHHISINKFTSNDIGIIPLLLDNNWSPEQIIDILLILKEFAGTNNLIQIYNQSFVSTEQNLFIFANKIGKYLNSYNKQTKVCIFLLHGIANANASATNTNAENNDLIQYISNILNNNMSQIKLTL